MAKAMACYAALTLLLIGFAPVALGDPLNLTTIIDPNAPLICCIDHDTLAAGINNSGEIVGSYYAGGFKGFIDNNGNFTTINNPNGGNTFLNGINDLGQIVGYSGNDGFVDTNGTFTTVDDPDATSTVVSGINNSGEMVGYYLSNTGTYGFMDINGTFTTIQDPNAAPGQTFVTGINNLGQIVGYAEEDGAYVGFVDTNGTFTPITDPNVTGAGSEIGTWVRGINDLGEIVGSYNDGSYTQGFIDDNGTFTSLDNPNAYSTSASGVNDSGDVVGQYFNFGIVNVSFDATSGFEGTPVAMPDGDPSPLLMIPALMIVLMLVRFWQKRPERAL
jgi:hypothetical protein